MPHYNTQYIDTKEMIDKRKNDTLKKKMLKIINGQEIKDPKKPLSKIFYTKRTK